VILFHHQIMHNFLSLLCFFQLFASGNELPAMDELGQNRSQLLRVFYIIHLGYPEGRHRACWDRH